jgi:hypothetical protein
MNFLLSNVLKQEMHIVSQGAGIRDQPLVVHVYSQHDTIFTARRYHRSKSRDKINFKFTAKKLWYIEKKGIEGCPMEILSYFFLCFFSAIVANNGQNYGPLVDEQCNPSGKSYGSEVCV